MYIFETTEDGLDTQEWYLDLDQILDGDYDDLVISLDNKGLQFISLDSTTNSIKVDRKNAVIGNYTVDVVVHDLNS